MKILFESKSGKELTKEFKSLKEAKRFVLRNKKVIKEAQIMEGPLGSGSLNPMKAIKKAGKSIKNYMDNKNIANEPKDASNRSRLQILNSILRRVIRNEKMEDLHHAKINYNSKGFYIDINSVRPPLHDIRFGTGNTDKNVDGYKINVNAISDKYGEEIPLSKLTLYIKKHDGKLPAERQLYVYFKDSIEKRYNVNVKNQLKKTPISHLSKTDVEDF